MTRDDGYTLAYALGFANMHILAPDDYALWRRAVQNSSLAGVRRLSGDARSLMPEASALLVLMRAYAPLKRAEGMLPLSAYYLCSQQGHLAALQLIAALHADGHRAISAALPAKPSAVLAGFGQPGRHSLLITPQHGSYVSLHLILTDAFSPDKPSQSLAPLCTGCGACQRACPVGAISSHSLNAPRCLRARLNEPLLDDAVKAHLSTLLGCDICQRACPCNAHVPCAAPGEDVMQVFQAKRLLQDAGQTQAQSLIGKNISANRILAQALVLSARMGESMLPFIQTHLGSPSEMVRDAALYAMQAALHPAGTPSNETRL